MALLNGSLQIGRSAIAVSQAALAVTGNNMANAATPGYTRQSAMLAPTQYSQIAPGKYTGTGVTILEIRRQVDAALNCRIRTAVADSQSNLVQQQALTRVEAAFNELTDSDLSSRLNAFFESWSSLQNQPQDIASRGVILQQGAGLTSFVRELRSNLDNIQADLDSQVRYQVTQADALATQIAALNRQVVTAEAGQAGSAAALRDQRDELLKQLSELINISTREMAGGAVNVYIGNVPLIQYADSKGLGYREELDANGNVTAEVIFADNELTVELSSGKIHGMITARDDQIGSIITDLDNWTQALILEVNHLHALGRGLDGLTTAAGTYGADDATASLADTDATGLAWAATNGVFNVHVTDSAGNTVTTQIRVKIGIDSSDTTLNDLAAALDAVAGITASVDGYGRLHIDSDAGFTFGFSAPGDLADATNVLAILGINTFFDGIDSTEVSVRSGLTARQLAASGDGLAGNGAIAGAIASLSTQGVASLGDMSLADQFSSLISTIASNSKASQDNYEAADVVLQTLESERQGIAGVSVDEEALNMIVFQRVFQGAARYVSVINEMLSELMAMAR
ncbi:MAG: flagellar hook-associated protein FlgK [Sedimentisphaerales bacterium]|nr:flagellar hook-associated protein FlgK [Sedimentisphaerales bacterium]